MRSPIISFASLLLGVLAGLAVGATGAAATTDVLWVGIQERENLPLAAEAALDSAVRSALIAAAPAGVSVESAAIRSPRALRALEELGFMGIGPGDVLHEREARALGVALDAKVTIRAWVTVAGNATTVTAFTAAINRRRTGINQVNGPAPPTSKSSPAAWARDLAGRVANGVAASISEMMQDAPQDAAGFAAAAAQFLAEGEPGIAVLEYDRAIGLDPREPAYYVGSARAYAALGDADAARHRLEIALGLAPDNTEARVELARHYLAAGNPAAGIRQSRRAVSAGGGFDALMTLGAALEKSGDVRGALEQYQKAAALNPADAGAARRVSELAAAVTQSASGVPPSAPAGPAAASASPDPLRYARFGRPTEAVRQLHQLVQQAGSVTYQPRDYVVIARAMDREMDAIISEARQSWDSLAANTADARKLTDALRALNQRSDALARASEGVVAPAALVPGYRHRVLAYNLLSQSDYDLLRYVQSRNAPDYDQGLLARRAAITELRRAWDLDARAEWPTHAEAEE